MKNLFMSAFVLMFVGCTQEALVKETAQRSEPITIAPALRLHKPTLRQAVPKAALKTPSRALTSKIPHLTLPKKFAVARVSPSAI